MEEKSRVDGGLIALAAAVSVVAMQPSAQAASAPKGQVQVDLVVGLPKGPDSAALVVSNIGSSGEDGVSACGESDFQVDSFFDIAYRIEPPPDRTIQTEMLSMPLTGTLLTPDNPGEAMDDLRCQVEAAGGDIYYGHVTILK